MRTKHKATIIGYDGDAYFYTDSPPTRNKSFFIAHRDNPAVGIIKKDELISAFKEFCHIGYLEVKKESLGNPMPLDSLFKNIYSNISRQISSRYGIEYIGNLALQKLEENLKESVRIPFYTDDSFIAALIKSRHMTLLHRILYSEKGILYTANLQQILQLLEKQKRNWELIQLLIARDCTMNNKNKDNSFVVYSSDRQIKIIKSIIQNNQLLSDALLSLNCG